LLERGADPTRIDNSGSTALHYAAWGCHTEIGNFLYDEKKVGTNHLSAESNLPIIEDAPPSLPHVNCMRMLLEKGADVNAQNMQGSTALHWIAGSGRLQVIRFLMAMGADAWIRDDMGRTPIDRAIETGDDGAVKILSGQLPSLSV